MVKHKEKEEKTKTRSLEDNLKELRKCFGCDIYAGFLIQSDRTLLIKAANRRYEDESLDDGDDEPDQMVQDHQRKKSLNYFG